MNRNKSFYKQWWFKTISILLVVAFLISIPFIISWAYLQGSHDGQPNTAFSASDMILFYGSVLSFIGTVSLGILALWQNHIFKKNNERQNKLSIRPYLFSIIEDETLLNVYEDKSPYYYFNYENGEFDFKNYNRNTPFMLNQYLALEKAYNDLENINNPDKNNTDKKIECLKKQTDALNELKKCYQVVVYNLKNYGNSAATNIEIKINNKKFTPLFSLAKDTEIKIILIMDFRKATIGEYKFKVDSKFYDIEDYGAYTQTETFKIKKSAENDLSLSFNEQISAPITQEEK